MNVVFNGCVYKAEKVGNYVHLTRKYNSRASNTLRVEHDVFLGLVVHKRIENVEAS